jgi:hypothetical protein
MFGPGGKSTMRPELPSYEDSKQLDALGPDAYNQAFLCHTSPECLVCGDKAIPIKSRIDDRPVRVVLMTSDRSRFARPNIPQCWEGQNREQVIEQSLGGHLCLQHWNEAKNQGVFQRNENCGTHCVIAKPGGPYVYIIPMSEAEKPDPSDLPTLGLDGKPLTFGASISAAYYPLSDDETVLDSSDSEAEEANPAVPASLSLDGRPLTLGASIPDNEHLDRSVSQDESETYDEPVSNAAVETRNESSKTRTRSSDRQYDGWLGKVQKLEVMTSIEGPVSRYPCSLCKREGKRLAQAEWKPRIPKQLNRSRLYALPYDIVKRKWMRPDIRIYEDTSMGEVFGIRSCEEHRYKLEQTIWTVRSKGEMSTPHKDFQNLIVFVTDEQGVKSNLRSVSSK